MARRYFVGLLIAWGLFAGLFAAGVLPIELGRRRSFVEALVVLAPVALGLGLVNTTLVAIGLGPVILWLRARFRHRLAPWHAAVIGAGSFPLYILLSWLAFGERDETFAGLLRFWWRVPGELLLHAVPAALGGAAFGAYVGAKRRNPAAELKRQAFGCSDPERRGSKANISASAKS